MKSGESIDLTSGSLYWPLMALSAPSMVSQLLQVTYQIIDTFWVGQLGPDAVAALSFASPLIFLSLTLGFGIEVAATALISQHRGADNDHRVDHVAGQATAFSLSFAFVLAVVGWFVTPWLITIIGAPQHTQIHTWAVQYARLSFVGSFTMYGFFIFEAILRGFGNTKTPMYLSVLGVTLNVVLDPFLIYGFSDNVLFGALGLSSLETHLHAATGFGGLGLPGAALATVASRGVTAVIGVAILRSGRVGIRLTLADMVPEVESYRQIIEIGVPTSIGASMKAFGSIVLTAIIATAGPIPVAAYGIGSRLSSFVFLPSAGLAQGTAAAVGQNLGAERPDRSERAVDYATATILVVLAAFSVLAWLFARPIVSVFVGNGPDRTAVISIGVQYLRISGLAFPFVGAFSVVTSAFRGAGKTKVDMAFSLLSLWAFRVPIAYALFTWTPATVAGVSIPALGASGIWYGIALSNVVSAVLAFCWFKRGTWKERLVDDDEVTTSALD